eukprot:1141410-Pelagomonas_calceolata.AAC.2
MQSNSLENLNIPTDGTTSLKNLYLLLMTLSAIRSVVPSRKITLHGCEKCAARRQCSSRPVFHPRAHICKHLHTSSSMCGKLLQNK